MLIKAVDDEEMTFLMHAAAGCGCRRMGQQGGTGASRQPHSSGDGSRDSGAGGGGDVDDGGVGAGDAAELGEAGRSDRMTAASSSAVAGKDPGLVVFKTAWALVKAALWKEQASERAPSLPVEVASLRRGAS